MGDQAGKGREYIISHIDEAIEKGWIKVYYQPVVRSLTGQLCGAESLARWSDDVVDSLGPGEFISILEESGEIYKLDICVLELVCKDLHELLSNGEQAFPVSVNFSRLDFVKCDMLKIVEDMVEKYDLPRDYLHIEFTESMIAQDEALMKGVIESFRNKGYEIWMDDFGSGYSSLTLLKDYQFDLLKMDMMFLSSMTERAKTIVRFTINMAKDIGIKTLTEGVETKEQIEFLTKIGCGKLQGYYYGKPETVHEMLSNLEKKGITIEERQWRRYYELASINARDTDVPLQILEFDGKTFNTLFMNDAFKQQVSTFGEDLSIYNKVMNNVSSPVHQKYVQFTEDTIKSKNRETFYYSDRGNYYYLKLQYLAENAGRYLIKASINNISLDQNTKERDRLDTSLRELNHLHEVVLHINIALNVVSPLMGGYKYLGLEGSVASSLVDCIDCFCTQNIYADEREAFMEFMDIKTIQKREEDSGKGFIEKPFRVRQKDGSYKWRTIDILSVPGTDGNEYMCTVSAVSKDVEAAMDNAAYTGFGHSDEKLDELTCQYAMIWDNLINDSTIKFFWKDKDRRFKGVSRAFLDFYEIKSLDDIIGKTDEEMHWHVDDVPYMDDELDVINKGAVVSNVRGQCIVNGVVHNIICNKMPVYDRGEIVGLVGYFADEDQELYRVQKLVNPSKVDNITRLMNNRFFLETMIDYATQYNDTGRNYGLILLHNASHRRILSDYGEKYANSVLREIGEKIIGCIGQTAAAARNKEAYFCVITYIRTREELEALGERLKSEIQSIHEIDDRSVTLRISMAICHRTDEGIKDEAMYQKVLEEIDRLEIDKSAGAG